MNIQIMNDVDNYFTPKVIEYKQGPKAADWNSIEAQAIRFAQISKVISSGKNDNFTLCDYGCGLGDYYDYLRKTYKQFQYFGIDASETIIDMARSKHQDEGSNWINGYTISSNYDYITASGIFNVRQAVSDDDWKAYILETISMFNKYASKGFAFNCLTKYSDKDRMKDYLYYSDPLFLFDFCKKNFSRNVALLHDYNLYDFTIIVRKEI